MTLRSVGRLLSSFLYVAQAYDTDCLEQSDPQILSIRSFAVPKTIP